jgi:hypothetical protein
VDEVDGKAVIRSLEDDLFIGFDGDAEEGKELIVGDRDVARIWDIEPVSDASNEVKCDPHILSTYRFLRSISFDRIKLRDSSYVIMFSVLDLNPGTHAQLELERSEDADNQTWIPIEGESCLEELSSFHTLTRSLD